MNTTSLKLLAVLALLLVALGCNAPDPTPQIRLLPAPPPVVPAMNLPQNLRQTNWTSPAGEGSCVIASTVSMVRWQRQYELAQKLRSTYSGGQTARSIQQKLASQNVPFVCTEAADPAFLDWASRTRRGAIVWYFPSHCVTFVGFSREADGVEYAWLLDNNRTKQFIKIRRDVFLKNWAGFGGFALSTLWPPSPPAPYQAYEIEGTR